MHDHAWRNPTGSAARWLQWLQSVGNDLADCEQELIDTVAAPTSQIRNRGAVPSPARAGPGGLAPAGHKRMLAESEPAECGSKCETLIGVRTDALLREHPTLTRVATRVVSQLRGWRRKVKAAEGATWWVQYDSFAERTEHLAGHLAAIVALAEEGQYPSSMVLARTALEHYVIDRLLLLADRAEETIEPGDVDQLDDMAHQWQQKTEPWTRDVVAFERTGRVAKLTRRKHGVPNEAGEVVERLSPYYPVLEHYDGSIGHWKSQAAILEPFRDLEHRVARAKRNQAAYNEFLKWKSLCQNLELNELASATGLVQLNTHYTFLSAFAHATSGYDVGRNSYWAQATREHLFSELALLYVSAIGIAQVETWSAYIGARSDRLQQLPVEVTRLTREARSIVGYFWFLVGQPQPYDRFQEASRRAHPALLKHQPPPTRPEDLLDHEVGYYANPFDRLRDLHNPHSEATTGFAYPPTWSRLHW